MRQSGQTFLNLCHCVIEL